MSQQSLYARAMTLRAFLSTRALQKRLKTREDVIRWQAKNLRRFLSRTAPRAGAYSGFRQISAPQLTDYPVMDKQALMSAFRDYNIYGVTAAQAWSALDQNIPIRGLSAGCSTGTSGNRGLYLVSNAERYKWLGVILAKALPDLAHVRHRVAVVLPANSRLYDAANESGRLALKFFDLTKGIAHHIAGIDTFSPTVIVAPPKVLRILAEVSTNISPRHIFSGAEMLDPVDRDIIEARFGVTVREIYMATEGLLGVACPHGTLHLAEDHVAFEWEADPAGGDLVAPVITDFTRSVQIMARYRMNDLLELSHAPCPCGSPLQAVSMICGRMDDVFVLPGLSGSDVHVTPDVIRNAVVDSDRRINDFRVHQTAKNAVAITLPLGMEPHLEAASIALRVLFEKLGVAPNISAVATPLSPPQDRKLRRVEKLC